jgi:3-oxoacid CoA-transferase subunit A
MPGLDKTVSSYEEALAGLDDNMTIIAGGFGLCGIPENLIKEIKRRGHQGTHYCQQQRGCRRCRFGLAARRPADQKNDCLLRGEKTRCLSSNY